MPKIPLTFNSADNPLLQTPIEECTDDKTRPWITIECGFPVISVSFGSGTPHLGGSSPAQRSKPYWTRFDFTKEMVLATGHVNGRIRIWNVRTGSLLLELMDHKMGVRDLAFAPDGSLRLISASLDKTLKVSNLLIMNCLLPINWETMQRILSIWNHFQGWDLQDDGSNFKTFHAHTNSVLWCCWSPNSRLMVSAGSDKTVSYPHWNPSPQIVSVLGFFCCVGRCLGHVRLQFTPEIRRAFPRGCQLLL